MSTPVTGAIRVVLRLEAIAVLIAAVVCYYARGESWALFALLILAPDISIAGYLARPATGAVVYNSAHTYLVPAAIALVAYAADLPAAWPIALIWTAHIAMDRSLGLGLKFGTSFQHTHLGTVGRKV